MVNEQKIVVIGCGAGGGTAAQFARKTDRNARITILEKSNYPQYSKCGLPYVISKKIKKFNELIEFSQEWFEKERINLILNATVKKISFKKNKLSFEKENKNKEIEFDKLIIATGAKTYIPPIKDVYTTDGTLVNGVCVLRTIDDGKKLYSNIKGKKKITIIGAGLIGLEIADSLNQKGFEVTVVEALPYILGYTLDGDMSQNIYEELKQKICIFIDHNATRLVCKNGKIKCLHLKNNKNGEEFKIETDIVIISTGSKPEVNLAKSIGCKIGENGGIVVNNKCETSIKGVYAVGDCTEYKDYITNKSTCVGLGSIAVRQGISAGINATDGNYDFPKGLLQTRTSKFFGFEVAAVGPVKNNLKNYPILFGKISGSSLISYYPGGKPIIIKIGINEKTGKIVCAQAVGSNAALRINVFACAIQNGANIEEMRKLETAYAPPIAPTLDVITLACDVAFLKYSRKKNKL